MEYVKKELELPKEVSELADGVAELVIEAKKALSDGFQPAHDLPVLMTEVVKRFPQMIQGLESIKDEWQQEKSKFVMAWLLAGEKVFEELL